jgi:DNA gyrase subunit A
MEEERSPRSSPFVEWPAEEGQQFIVMRTRKGGPTSAFSNLRAGGIIAMGVDEGDAVIAKELSDGKEQIFPRHPRRHGHPLRGRLTSVDGRSLPCPGASAVRRRRVVAMEVVREGGAMLTVTQNGYGKRTTLDEYRLQSRGGFGTINIQASARNGKVVGVAYVHGDDELMLISQQGKILRMVTSGIRAIGRATQGVRLMAWKKATRSCRWHARREEVEEGAANGGWRTSELAQRRPDPTTTATRSPRSSDQRSSCRGGSVSRGAATPVPASRTSPTAS